MADEPKKQSDDIQGILSDLDAILSDLGTAAGGKAAPPAASPAPKPKPAEPVAPPVAAPPPAPAPVKPPPPPVAAKPPAAAPPAAVPPAVPAAVPPPSAPELKIELAPRDGSLAPPAKKPAEPAKAEPAKPPSFQSKPPLEVSLSPAAPPPAPAPATPAPAAAQPPKPAETVVPAATAAPIDIPADTPKDQIRRVAYVHTASCAEARNLFAAFLAQSARTISKKPLFLRQVMALEIAQASDPNAVFEKARQARAVAILAVVEDWPPAKVEALTEACARGGLMFRVVPVGDVQKKSTAVDVIVDMMLLPGEA